MDGSLIMGSKRPAAHKPSMPKSGSDAHYRAQSDMHTLAQAASIKADPARHSAAKAMAREQATHLRKVAGRTSK